jgi:glutathione S-transferase
MNLGKRFAKKDRGPAVAADVARIAAIWAQARARFGGGGGPFLYGEFSAADAMFAPVVTRLDTYQLDVDRATSTYMDAILTHPSFVRWRSEAVAEPWVIEKYEAGETAVDVFHAPSR